MNTRKGNCPKAPLLERLGKATDHFLGTNGFSTLPADEITATGNLLCELPPHGGFGRCHLPGIFHRYCSQDLAIGRVCLKDQLRFYMREFMIAEKKGDQLLTGADQKRCGTRRALRKL